MRATTCSQNAPTQEMSQPLGNPSDSTNTYAHQARLMTGVTFPAMAAPLVKRRLPSCSSCNAASGFTGPLPGKRSSTLPSVLPDSPLSSAMLRLQTSCKNCPELNVPHVRLAWTPSTHPALPPKSCNFSCSQLTGYDCSTRVFQTAYLISPQNPSPLLNDHPDINVAHSRFVSQVHKSAELACSERRKPAPRPGCLACGWAGRPWRAARRWRRTAAPPAPGTAPGTPRGPWPGGRCRPGRDARCEEGSRRPTMKNLSKGLVWAIFLQKGPPGSRFEDCILWPNRRLQRDVWLLWPLAGRTRLSRLDLQLPGLDHGTQRLTSGFRGSEEI